MSKARQDTLPQWEFNEAFFDHDIQRFHQENTPKPHPWLRSSETEAWPLMIHCAVERLAICHSGYRDHFQVLGEDFGECLLTDSLFTSALLLKVAKYHSVPQEQWSIVRKVAYYQNSIAGDPMSGWDRTGPEPWQPTFYSWKDIAGLIGCHNTPDDLRKRFEKELKSRRQILRKWQKSIAVWDDFKSRNSGREYPWEHLRCKAYE